MSERLHTDVVVAGGGLAGLVTALECLRAGLRVVIVDRDTPDRLGGLARWAFGGMALVGTQQQARMGIPDEPERALRDWLRFGELGPSDTWPRAWAACYVEHSRALVYDWLVAHGLRFMPAVNWVERGLNGEGNSLPRYHVLWGTARALTLCMLDGLRQHGTGGRLRILSGHRVTALQRQAGAARGAAACRETGGQIGGQLGNLADRLGADGRGAGDGGAGDGGAGGPELRIDAQTVVLAMGGINGAAEQVQAHWPADRPRPAAMLNGAHPFADGRLHRIAAQAFDARLTHVGEMWNYAAGIPHPQPHFPGHGLSLIPCKSALWLDHRGRRIGPQPLVTGFDTHALCQRVAALEQPWTWQLLNRRIAARELAISGAEHNPRVRDQHKLRFILDTLRGSDRLLQQMLRESPHVLADDTLAGLAARMNALTGVPHIDPAVLQRTADAFDANFIRGDKLHNDDQLRRIVHARQWLPDRLRTCQPAPLQMKGAGPFVAIQTQLITRKSLGGLQTDLESRVLDAGGQPIPGLYGVGEAAGFGGGGANGRRSLEGTFLPGCILTARAAARSITQGRGLTTRLIPTRPDPRPETP